MTITALPTLFTQRRGALLTSQWATRDDLPDRAAPFDSLDATPSRWHMPPVVVVDIADLDLLADWFGDRCKAGYTIAVGVGEHELPDLRDAVDLDRVDFAARVDDLPGRFMVSALLDRAGTWTPDQLRTAVADAAHGSGASRFRAGRRHARHRR